jgi:hypothetical protein
MEKNFVLKCNCTCTIFLLHINFIFMSFFAKKLEKLLVQILNPECKSKPWSPIMWIGAWKRWVASCFSVGDQIWLIFANLGDFFLWAVFFY